MFKKATALTAAVAFIRSPAGQEMLGKAKDFANDPRTRAKAEEIVKKLRRPTPGH